MIMNICLFNQLPSRLDYCHLMTEYIGLNSNMRVSLQAEGD